MQTVKFPMLFCIWTFQHSWSTVQLIGFDYYKCCVLFTNEGFYEMLLFFLNKFIHLILQTSQEIWKLFIITHLWLQIYHFRHVLTLKNFDASLFYQDIITRLKKLLVWLAESKVKVNLTLQQLK